MAPSVRRHVYLNTYLTCTRDLNVTCTYGTGNFTTCVSQIVDGREKGGNRERKKEKKKERKKERGEEREMVSWSRLVERLHHSPIPTSFIYVHC